MVEIRGGGLLEPRKKVISALTSREPVRSLVYRNFIHTELARKIGGVVKLEKDSWRLRVPSSR